jgi:hypothetical protein
MQQVATMEREEQQKQRRKERDREREKEMEKQKDQVSERSTASSSNRSKSNSKSSSRSSNRNFATITAAEGLTKKTLPRGQLENTPSQEVEKAAKPPRKTPAAGMNDGARGKFGGKQQPALNNPSIKANSLNLLAKPRSREEEKYLQQVAIIEHNHQQKRLRAKAALPAKIRTDPTAAALPTSHILAPHATNQLKVCRTALANTFAIHNPSAPESSWCPSDHICHP